MERNVKGQQIEMSELFILFSLLQKNINWDWLFPSNGPAASLVKR